MNTKEMSNDELQSLIREHYQTALNDGTLYNIATCCRVLGKTMDDRYGPKYTYDIDNVHVFVDDYGNYMNVEVNDKRVCSTHPCSQFIIPGNWVVTILKNLPVAQEIILKKENNSKEIERQRLLELIG